MTDDNELLRRYADANAQEAFAELVHRHLDFVCSAALRQLIGDVHLAADAAQRVFTDLARKAGALAGQRVLAGWLFTSTRFAAALTGHAVAAAPAGLAATITGAALAGLTTTTFMGITKLQAGLAAALGVAGVTGYVLQADAGARRQEEIAALQREQAAVARLQAENLRLKRAQSEAGALRAAATTAEALRAEEAALNARVSAVRAVPPPAPRRAPERVALTGEVFEISRLDESPKPVSQPRPLYPTELRQAGVTGSVVVDFVVMADGTVRNAFALRSTEPRLEAAAVEAVSQWRFEPGRKGGNAVQTHLQIPIVFTVAKNNEVAESAADKSRPSPAAPWF